MADRFTLLLTVALLASVPGLAAAQTKSDTDDPFERARRDINKTFAQAEQEIHEDFRRFSQIINESFAQFEAELREVWGDDPKMPEQKVWAGYSEDLQTRVIIDYENGIVAVESVSELDDEQQVQEKLQSVIQENSEQLDERDLLAKKTGDNLEAAGLITRQEVKPVPAPQPQVEAPPPPLPTPPPAPPKVLLEKPKPAKQPDVKQAARPVAPPPKPLKAEEHVQKEPKRLVFVAPLPKSKPKPPGGELSGLVDKSKKPTFTKRMITAADGSKKTVKRVEMPMVHNHLERQASRFQNPVVKNADDRKIPRGLVFSIMKNESSFNPRARSHIPAYGLMQLVPTSGGADAMQFVTGKRGLKPTPEYLYEPSNNILLGATYLHILYYRYLKSVTNPESRLYCAIAAYNTGAGNVAKAFTGNRRIREAAKIINRMKPDQVYDHLVKKLPYDETRRYLYKVRRDMKLFKKWESAG